LGRKSDPLTVITVSGPPEVTSRVRYALGLGLGEGEGTGEGVGEGGGLGVGVGDGTGDGIGVGEAIADGAVEGDAGGVAGVGDAAISRNQRGSVARTRSRFMRSPER
jgi:hypothetical protein